MLEVFLIFLFVRHIFSSNGSSFLLLLPDMKFFPFGSNPKGVILFHFNSSSLMQTVISLPSGVIVLPVQHTVLAPSISLLLYFLSDLQKEKGSKGKERYIEDFMFF